jgi:hypothetical protein
LFSCASEECNERSLRVGVFVLPTLAVECCLGTKGGAALGPWLTALTVLQSLDLCSKARVFLWYWFEYVEAMTVIDDSFSVLSVYFLLIL